MLTQIKKVVATILSFILMYIALVVVIQCAFRIRRLNIYQNLLEYKIKQIEVMKSIPTVEA